MLLNKLEILEELVVLEGKKEKLLKVLKHDNKCYTVRLDISDDKYCSDSEVFNVDISSLRFMIENELNKVNEVICKWERLLIENNMINK